MIVLAPTRMSPTWNVQLLTRGMDVMIGRSREWLMDQYPVARPPYMLTTKGDVALYAIGPDLQYPGIISHHRPRYCGSHLSSDPIIHRRFTSSWINGIFYPPNVQTVPDMCSIKSCICDWSITPGLESASVIFRDLVFCVPTRRHSFIVLFGPIFIYRHEFSRILDAFHDLSFM